MKYDYLVVGAGLFGSVFARMMKDSGKKVLIIEKNDHVAGHIYTKEIEGINVHYYGAHIFHTSNKEVWDFVNKFASFNNFVNSPLANYKGKLYNLPFNMNTFYQLWGVKTPKEAMDKIKSQQSLYYKENPLNLEEQAINLVGPEIYEKLIKGYTEKQWGREATNLPPFIIKRLPVRFTYDNNYFRDLYQGIPIGGYTKFILNMLNDIEVMLNEDYFNNRDYYDNLAEKIVYTGPIDTFYNYSEGILEYRSLRFEHEILDNPNFQGNAVINYTEREVPYTRIIEHKHFEFGTQDKTIISKEYPDEWQLGKEQYYPINDDKNNELYLKYYEKTLKETKYLFGGRLAQYKYYDMHIVVEKALELAREELNNK